MEIKIGGYQVLCYARILYELICLTKDEFSSFYVSNLNHLAALTVMQTKL